MDKNKKHDLALFRHSIMWLEKYIEVKELLPNWSTRKQTDGSRYIRRNWDKSTPEKAILGTLGISLLLGFGCKANGKRDKAGGRREECKTEFYKWLDATGIKADNCPPKLKQVLFNFHEVIKNRAGGQRILSESENGKRELEPDSPEYQEQLQKVFSTVSEAHASGKAFEIDSARFNGNEKAGKATFETIANSLSASDKENFHFWPQMTEEERAEDERKNKRPDFILQGKRIHAINEITQALHQEPKLTNNDLEPKSQMWEIEINQSKNIIEIQNIQNRVLADIKAKRQFFFQQEAKKKTTKWLIIGGILTAILSLIGLVCLIYYQKKNEKRK